MADVQAAVENYRPVQRQLWIELLRADLNRRYYSRIAGRNQSRDFWTKLFLAITTSGTVAGWSFWKDEISHPNLVVAWKALSGISAIVAIAFNLAHFSKKSEWASGGHISECFAS